MDKILNKLPQVWAGAKLLGFLAAIVGGGYLTIYRVDKLEAQAYEDKEEIQELRKDLARMDRLLTIICTRVVENPLECQRRSR